MTVVAAFAGFFSRGCVRHPPASAKNAPRRCQSGKPFEQSGLNGARDTGAAGQYTSDQGVENTRRLSTRRKKNSIEAALTGNGGRAIRADPQDGHAGPRPFLKTWRWNETITQRAHYPVGGEEAATLASFGQRSHERTLIQVAEAKLDARPPMQTLGKRTGRGPSVYQGQRRPARTKAYSAPYPTTTTN